MDGDMMMEVFGCEWMIVRGFESIEEVVVGEMKTEERKKK